MTRISAKYVYTLQDDDPIREGYVEVNEDGTLTEVGECTDFGTEANVFDGALVPGFVNAHCHVELSHLQGKFTKGSGMAGFIDQINSLRDCVSADEKKTLLQRQMDGMWSAGVSAMADISNGPDSFPAKRASRMYTRTFIEVFGSEPGDCAGVVALARELEFQARSFGLDASITPHSCYTTSPELLTAAAEAGLRTGFISYHSQESGQEEEMMRFGRGEMYENRIRSGMSVPPAGWPSSLDYFLSRLDAIGDGSLLDGHILLVHNVCLDPAPARRALTRLGNVWWALCPLSNLFIHNALPPVEMMRDMGLNLCVGTDSLSSNDALDMVGEVRCLQDNFPRIPLGEILRWACLGGARFLGKADVLGTIEVGKRPGIVGISEVDGCGRLTARSRSVRLM